MKVIICDNKMSESAPLISELEKEKEGINAGISALSEVLSFSGLKEAQEKQTADEQQKERGSDCALRKTGYDASGGGQHLL